MSVSRFVVLVVVLVLWTNLRAAQAAKEVRVTVSAKHSVHFAGQDPTYLSWLAGQLEADPLTASGAVASPRMRLDLKDGDTIPTPIDVSGLGSMISIASSGVWDHGTPVRYTSGPAGRGVFQATEPAYESLGVSRIGADLNTLVGVFLAADAAHLPPPRSLIVGADMTRPLLGQTFAIGAGLDNIVVPAAATSLYLALHDGVEWNNNHGSIEAVVTAVPEPHSLLAYLAPLMLLVRHARRRRCRGWRLD